MMMMMMTTNIAVYDDDESKKQDGDDRDADDDEEESEVLSNLSGIVRLQMKLRHRWIMHGGSDNTLSIEAGNSGNTRDQNYKRSRSYGLGTNRSEE